MTTSTKSLREAKGYRRGLDLFRVLCWVASAVTVATLAWMIFEITRQSMPAIEKYGLGFLISDKWQPYRDLYGVLPFLLGTGISSFIAILLALPLGLAVAIFLSEDF